jgi:hypothetical protein
VVLVGGMALGAVIAVDGAAAAFRIAMEMEGDGAGAFFVGGLAMIGLGAGLMLTGYRKFRYGEQYEFRGHQRRKGRSKNDIQETISKVMELTR